VGLVRASSGAEVVTVVVLRTLLGDALRDTRLRQQRTLKEVSQAARVSLGYLSEVERGQKEASSELLASICQALGIRLSDVLRRVSDDLAVVEPHPLPVSLPAAERVPAPVGEISARVSAAA
jgi:transcriptional regulator with XRE-family HTH domain